MNRWMLDRKLAKTTRVLNRMRAELDRLHAAYLDTAKQLREQIRAMEVEQAALTDQAKRTARMASWLESGGFHGDD